MVLQVVYVFHQLCLHNDVRKFIIQDTEAVAYLVNKKSSSRSGTTDSDNKSK